MKIINQVVLERIEGGYNAEKPPISVDDLIIWDQPIVDTPIIDWCGTKPKPKNNSTDLE